MILDWIGHSHGRLGSPVHRLPAWIKLGAGLILITGSVAVPTHWEGWFIGMGLFLGGAIVVSRIRLLFLLQRLVLLSPFVLGVALVNAFQPGAAANWRLLMVRSFLCVLTVVLTSNTTPFSHVLRVLRSVRVPVLMITTLALMHRYLFVLVEEAGRMQRARASRSFAPNRSARWTALATVASQLFVRASERAERIYDAMCARGWK